MSQDEIWETATRQKIAVGDMEEQHLRNTLRLVLGKPFKGTEEQARDRLRAIIKARRTAQARLVFANNPWVDL